MFCLSFEILRTHSSGLQEIEAIMLLLTVSAFARMKPASVQFWSAGPRANSLKTKQGIVVSVVQGQIAQEKVMHKII